MDNGNAQDEDKVWESYLTEENTSHLDPEALGDLINELDDAVMEICQGYEIA
jgi:hypothetical protein